MSTKIYNGYRSKLPIEALLKEFSVVKQDFVNILETSFLEGLVKHTIIDVLDNTEYKKEKHPFDKELIKQYNFAEDVINKSNKYERLFFGDVDIDLAISCSVFPLNGETLILLYSDNSNATKFWEGLGFIEDYHYQNQTDPPEELSEQEWEKRKTDWDLVLGGDGYGRPVDFGYTFTFHDRELPNKFRLFQKYKDTLDKFIPEDIRRKKNILFTELWNREFSTFTDDEKKNGTFSKYCNFRQKYRGDIEGGKYAEELEKIILTRHTFKENAS